MQKVKQSIKDRTNNFICPAIQEYCDDRKIREEVNSFNTTPLGMANELQDILFKFKPKDANSYAWFSLDVENVYKRVVAIDKVINHLKRKLKKLQV